MASEDELRTYLRRATADLSQARRRLAEIERRAHEPIAVIGMGCRYAGGIAGPQDLWDLADAGREALGPFPADRGWDLERLHHPDPAHPGTVYATRGGFLDAPGAFDAEFFRMSPRTALATDPQHRLFLENCWEALEHAAIDPGTLRGEPVGVWAGSLYEYYALRHTNHLPADLEGTMPLASTPSMLSGRVSYTFGFEGPSVSVDTACSTSLVAVHLAAQSLRRGECTLALAGGVSVMAATDLFVTFSRQRGLAPDGRCKPFSAQADGTVWGEGSGVLLLERLSDAQRSGHRVLGLIRGTAVNQDGASNGQTAPSGPAQEKVIAQALADAGLAPQDVDAVEAHGTGTALGDPIEANALINAYGRGRAAGDELQVGSIKSNLGHTQAAAGVAGIIKMLLAMRHGRLPRTLHGAQPTPKVAWAGSGIELTAQATDWPRRAGAPRRAGVSSFGISGTNVHVILEEPEPVPHAPRPAAPIPAPSDAAGPAPVAWVLSARTASALERQAGRLADLVAAPGADTPGADAHDPLDVAYSLAATRARFEERAVAVGRGLDRLAGAVAGFAARRPDSGVVAGTAKPGARVAFLFTGQGGQRPGMGRELYAAYPVFAAAFDELCDALDRHLDRPLREVMWAQPGSAEAQLLDQTAYTQPALFAYEVAAYRLLASLGLSPHRIGGHSVGELAAAHVAGIWTLEDAAALVAARGRLMQCLPEGGAMYSVSASAEEVGASLAAQSGPIAIAAVNAPGEVVVSGAEDACAAVAGHWAALGRRTRRLTVSHAFHSPLMDPMLDAFAAQLAAVQFHEPALPAATLETNLGAERSWTDPGYWVEHVRSAVGFAAAVARIDAAGTDAYLEIGPRSALAGMIRACLPESGAAVAATCRRRLAEPEGLLTALAELHVRGVDVDWAALAPGGRTIELPTYAFERERYWLAGPPLRSDEELGLAGTDGHPMLRAALALADGAVVATGRIATGDLPWLADHVVGTAVVVPGAAVLDLVARVAQLAGFQRVQELMLEAPMILPDRGALSVQVSVEASGAVRVYARAGEDAPWTRRCSGTAGGHISDSEEATTVRCDWAAAWPPAGAEPLALDDGYEHLAGLGYVYGPAFRGVQAAWRRGDEVFAEVRVPAAARADGFGIHPVLLDSALHAYVLAGDSGRLRLPFVFRGARILARAAESLRVRIAVSGADRICVQAADAAHTLVLGVDELLVRAASDGALSGTGAAGAHGYGEVEWSELPAPAPDHAATWVGLGTPVPGMNGYPAYADLAAAADTGIAAKFVLYHVPAQQAGADLPERVRTLTGEVLDLVRRWLADPRFAASRLVIAADPGSVCTAALWGLVRGAQAEAPERLVLAWIPDASPASAAPVIAAAAAQGEDQVQVRGGRVLVPRIVQHGPALGGGPVDLGEGTVLITGGTGELGALVARRLVEKHGVRSLCLLSRSGPAAAGAPALAAELEGLGAQVAIEACDGADRGALARVLAAIPAGRPLVGVVHAAGVLDDALLGDLTAQRLAGVLRPKADTAWLLHELTAHLPLRLFVMFSSIAGVLGNAGQASYGAANAFLDALAAHRRAAGLPGLSLAWGIWDTRAGMGANLSAAARARLAGFGIAPLTEDEGLDLFDDALASATPGGDSGDGAPCALAVHWDLAGLRARAEAGERIPAPLRRLARLARPAATAAEAPRPAAAPAVPDSELAGTLAGLPAQQAHAAVVEYLRGHAASLLQAGSSGAVPADRTFADLGFDSLAAVEMREILAEETGLNLPETLVFDFPTIDALAGHLVGVLRPGPGEAAQPAHAPNRAVELAQEIARSTADLETAAGADRERLVAALRAALDQLGAREPDPAAAGELTGASDEEIFAFIDTRL